MQLWTDYYWILHERYVYKIYGILIYVCVVCVLPFILQFNILYKTNDLIIHLFLIIYFTHESYFCLISIIYWYNMEHKLYLLLNH